MAKEEIDGKYIIRIRGLPWSATDTEIINFLDNVNIVNGEQGIHRTFTREGRPSGEAYVELCNENDLENAITKDHQTMGRRYIEVFESTYKEMEYVLKRSGADTIQQGGGDGVVRCRGLPFQCTKEEIAQFFSGLDIIPEGITIPTVSGRSSGEAFVQFSSQAQADKALRNHKHKIGHRYIEIFKSNEAEMRDSLRENPRMGQRSNFRPGPYDRPMQGGGRGGMRGGGGGFGRGRGPRGRMMGGYGNYGGGDHYDRYSGNMGGHYGHGGQMKGYGGYGGGHNSGDGYNDGNTSGEYIVHMRGLPFSATNQEVCMFFSPLVPVDVFMEYGKDKRFNGEADVSFASLQDAQAAMKKDRALMQHRYIELFSRFDASEGCGMGGYGGGMGGYGRGPNMGYDDESYGMGMRGGNYTQF